MTQEETKKGNKLIAEFEHRKFFGNLIDKFGEGTFNELPEMNYHTSWDWLMPVVEKIEKDFDFAFNIFKNETWIADEEYRNTAKGWNRQVKTDSKINSVYQSVIQFINWYNTQTPHP